MICRLNWVDYAKGIGIILVVYGHVARGLMSSGIITSDSLFKTIDSVIYSFHMPLFFFLSGLFFFRSSDGKDTASFLSGKIDTIIYPYIIWSLTQGGVEFLLSKYTNGSVSIFEVINLLVPRAQFWFLYALFFIFVICSVFVRGLKSNLVPFFIVSIGLYFLLDYVVLKSHLFIISYLAQYLVFFLFGVVFNRFKLSAYIESVEALIILFVLFVLCQYFFHIYAGYTYQDKGFQTLTLALLSIFLITSLSINLSKLGGGILYFVAHFGTSSMAIFLLHILAGSGARVVLSRFFGINDISLHLVVGCSAGVALPILCIRIFSLLNIKYAFSAPVCNWIGNFIFKR